MDDGTTPPPTPSVILPPEVPLRTITLAKVGMLAWAVALLVVLLLPSLRTDERSWWVWVPVAGLALGAAGYLYLRRGRGNAAMA